MPPLTETTGDGLLRISGLLGSTSDGHIHADFASQVHLALLNLRKLLLTSGATIFDIKELTIRIVNEDVHGQRHKPLIEKFFRGHGPKVVAVPVTDLGNSEALLQLDVIISRSSRPRPNCELPAGNESVDVIIIGAGLAGLTAAREVLKSGLSCIVLEARNRVGGKTWSETSPSGEGINELGAAWFNDASQTRINSLVREYGLEVIEQNTSGAVAAQGFNGEVDTFPYGELPNFDDETIADIIRIRDGVEADCQALSTLDPLDHELDAMTLEAYLKSRNASETSLATVTVWTRAMFGVDPCDLSALFFQSYCKSSGGILLMRSDRKGGGQHLRLREGTQAISQKLVAGLPENTIHLNSPVKDILQHGASSVEVVTAGGSKFHGRKVITTVPSPVLRDINFSPPLDFKKQLWTESATYGYYSKVMLVFKTPFWVSRGFCGLAQSFVGPVAVVRDTSSPRDDNHVLTCFIGGSRGREWADLSDSERKNSLLAQIATLLNAGNDVTQDLVGVVVHDWGKDRWGGYGCPYTHLPPGVLDTVGSSALRQSYGNVHFAGTETALRWRGFMEGAIESGERAAREVCKDLK